MLFTLRRIGQTDHSTHGTLYDDAGQPLCHILERGLKNPDGHPRIPAGTYAVKRKPLGASHFDHALLSYPVPHYRGILWLPEVPGRSNIEIHTANFVSELLGCLATGESIVRDPRGDFAIAGGTSKPAYAIAYPVISAAIDDEGGAYLRISDPS